MPRARWVVAALLLVASCRPVTAEAACSIQFIGPDGTSYPQAQLAKLVDEQIRTKLSRVPGSFKVSVESNCNQGAKQTVVLTFDDTDYYITDIQDHHLTEDESKYTNSAVTLSLATFESELARAQNIDQLQLAEKQDVVKTLAFFLAETARFAEIETIAASILNNGCTAPWLNYATLLRRWAYISKLAIHENSTQGTVRGGKDDDLLAPISSAAIAAYNSAIRAGKDGPDASFVDPSDWDKSILVPAASCNK